MEEKIILFLQKNGTLFWDLFFAIESYLASWIFGIFAFVIIILFVDKKFGMHFGLGFIITLAVNYAIKEIVARPRPYVLNKQIANKLQTIGKSFPSGHMLSATFVSLSILFLLNIMKEQGKLNVYRKKWVRFTTYIAVMTFLLLTAVSRMYLGQHYLSDLIAGFMLGVFANIIILLLFKRFDKKTKV